MERTVCTVYREGEILHGSATAQGIEMPRRRPRFHVTCRLRPRPRAGRSTAGYPRY